MGIIISIVIGALVGWLAGKIMKSKTGLLRNIIIGIVGGFLGSWVAGLFGISSTNIIGTVIIGVVGACLLIVLLRLILGRKF